MKYCHYKTYEYNKDNIQTTSNYVTLNDIKKFHGEQFTNQWLKFVKIGNLASTNFGIEQGYYYIDYQFYAQRTKMWLESE